MPIDSCRSVYVLPSSTIIIWVEQVIIWVELTPEQRAYYKAIYERQIGTVRMYFDCVWVLGSPRCTARCKAIWLRQISTVSSNFSHVGAFHGVLAWLLLRCRTGCCKAIYERQIGTVGSCCLLVVAWPLVIPGPAPRLPFPAAHLGVCTPQLFTKHQTPLLLMQLLAGASAKNMPNLRNLAMELRKVCCHPVSNTVPLDCTQQICCTARDVLTPVEHLLCTELECMKEVCCHSVSGCLASATCASWMAISLPLQYMCSVYLIFTTRLPLPQYLCNGLEEDIEARKAAAGHAASELDQLVQVQPSYRLHCFAEPCSCCW